MEVLFGLGDFYYLYKFFKVLKQTFSQLIFQHSSHASRCLTNNFSLKKFSRPQYTNLKFPQQTHVLSFHLHDRNIFINLKFTIYDDAYASLFANDLIFLMMPNHKQLAQPILEHLTLQLQFFHGFCNFDMIMLDLEVMRNGYLFDGASSYGSDAAGSILNVLMQFVISNYHGRRYVHGTITDVDLDCAFNELIKSEEETSLLEQILIALHN